MPANSRWDLIRRLRVNSLQAREFLSAVASVSVLKDNISVTQIMHRMRQKYGTFCGRRRCV